MSFPKTWNQAGGWSHWSTQKNCQTSRLLPTRVSMIYPLTLFIPISMAILGTDLLEVPTIYKAYFSGRCKGIIYPQNMAKNMVRTYLHFRILEFPLTICFGDHSGSLVFIANWAVFKTRWRSSLLILAG